MYFSEAKVDTFWINGAQLRANEALELVLWSVNALRPRSLVTSGLTSKNHQMMLFKRKALKSHFAKQRPRTFVWMKTVHACTPVYGFSIRLKRQKLRETVEISGTKLGLTPTILYEVWLPSTPDLNLLDFYLWVHLKTLVYTAPVANLLF
jgi:hypothetical protein